jgi:nicotinamidase-related amidase
MLMDFQNYGVHPKGYWAQRDPGQYTRLVASRTLDNAAKALAAARVAKLRVIHVVNRWREGQPDLDDGIPMWAGRRGTDSGVEGTWGAEIVEQLAPAADEIVVVKRTVSALATTDLERLLTLFGIRTLVLAGIATNFVVEGTAREAADRGYRVIALRDACETWSAEAQRFSIEILSLLGEVITVDEFVRLVAGPPDV